MHLKLLPMQKTDWQEAAAIYLQGIATGLATFSTEAPSWETWDRSHLPVCRWVARDRDSGELAAWAALGKSFEREFYRGVAEVSIYVDNRRRGQGVGKALLRAMIDDAERQGFWTLESLIIRENTASIRLHESCGFRLVGVRERFGRMPSTGRWHDVLLLERRSEKNGRDYSK